MPSTVTIQITTTRTITRGSPEEIDALRATYADYPRQIFPTWCVPGAAVTVPEPGEAGLLFWDKGALSAIILQGDSSDGQVKVGFFTEDGRAAEDWVSLYHIAVYQPPPDTLPE